jgi:hypothetical protein
MTGFREATDFGEDRALVNEILEAALGHYGHPFSFVSSATRTEADPLYLFQQAPALPSMFMIAALVKKGELTEFEAGQMGTFADGIVSILIRAHDGDERAQNQLKAIHKLIYPDTYEVPATVIAELVDHYHTRPSLARGWRLRNLMGELSWVVSPARKNAKSNLDGPIAPTTNKNRNSHTMFDPISKKRISAAKVADRHWKRGVTLKTLAIRVYLEELHKQGFEALDERSLKRDLKAVEEWEKTLPKERREWGVLVVTPRKPNVHLPVRDFSEGWKKRKRTRRKE